MTVAKEALRECPVFASLTDAALEKIFSLAEEKEYAAGTAIFQEGNSAEELFMILEGKVALQTPLSSAQGQVHRRVTVDVVTKNDVVGWSSIVEPHVYMLSAVCLNKVRALSFNGTRLRWLLKEDHHIGYEVLNGIIKVVASRLDDTRQVLASERLLLMMPERPDVKNDK